MTKIMFEIPSDLSIKKVVITPACVDGADPDIIRDTKTPRQALGKKN
jgi:ATP-dependent protease Clp ATPase subunit